MIFGGRDRIVSSVDVCRRAVRQGSRPSVSGLGGCGEKGLSTAIRFLTPEQHGQVLSRLLDLGREIDGKAIHAASPEYTSLMVCFLLHNIAAVESILRLWRSFGGQWFPATVGYIIARSIFETDVTAHYISQQPKDRADAYILFERVLEKEDMEVCAKHKSSTKDNWGEAMCHLWNSHWARKEKEVHERYNEVRSRFESLKKGRSPKLFRNWSGKSIREMAVAVQHEEAYDVFYSELSSFTHMDVRAANRFLRLAPGEMSWSQRSREFDVGNVFRHASSFLTCYLEFFGRQFGVWDSRSVERCWQVTGL